MKASLFVCAMALGLAGLAHADTGNPVGATRMPSVNGHFGAFRDGSEVLVVRDYLPWGGDVVPSLTAHGVNVTVISTDMLSGYDFSPYCMVYVTAGQTQPQDITSVRLNNARTAMGAWVQGGGTLMYVTGSWGAVLRLPGGVNTQPHESSTNLFLAENPLSPGMPFPEFEGNQASHDQLLNLPAGAHVYTVDDLGGSTAAEFTYGAGRILAMTQPLECYIGVDCAGIFPHMITLLDNALSYSLSRGCSGQQYPGELSLYLNATGSYACDGESYVPATGTVSVDIYNSGGSDCENVSVTLNPDLGLAVVGSPLVTIPIIEAGGHAVAEFAVAPTGDACDDYIHFVAQVGCDTCPANSIQGQAWVPCCGVVDAQESPLAFQLKGNHPNPFNPVTSVSFSLSRTAHVNLGVYDLSGQRVATLVDGMREAGDHAVVFDATLLPSGLYISHLASEGFSQSGRMLLVK